MEMEKLECVRAKKKSKMRGLTAGTYLMIKGANERTEERRRADMMTGKSLLFPGFLYDLFSGISRIEKKNRKENRKENRKKNRKKKEKAEK